MNHNHSKNDQETFKVLIVGENFIKMREFYITDFCNALAEAFKQYCSNEAVRLKKPYTAIAEETLSAIGITPTTFGFWKNPSAVINKIENPGDLSFSKASLPDYFRVAELCAILSNYEPLRFLEGYLKYVKEMKELELGQRSC